MKALINYIKNHKKGLLLWHALMLPLFGVFAEETKKNGLADLLSTQEGMFIIIIASFIAIVSVLMLIVLYLLIQLRQIIFKAQGLTAEERETAWDRFYVKYISGKHAPVGKEAEKLMDHEYDGIWEMDHTMPPWLRYIFIGTIVFAIYYLAAYLVFDIGDSQYKEYADELKEAELLAEARAGDTPPITFETVEKDNSAEAMANGKQIYDISCSPCHAKDGGGTIGPNLTDEYWIHGGSLQDVFRVITEGVPAKGMIPWKDQLSPKSIQDVTNYVLSLQGSSPASPKEPQGEKYVPEEVDEEGKEEITSDENSVVSI